MAEFPAQLHAEIEKYEQRHAENPEGRDFVPLANAYRKSGDLELAEGLLRAGLRRYPEYLSAHIVLGRVLADRGAASEAAAAFQHVLSVDPQNLIALRTLGELAAGQGRQDEASYWFAELLAVDPMNDEARAALAAIEPAGAEPSADFESGASWWEEPATAEPADPQDEAAAADVSEMGPAPATPEQTPTPGSGADVPDEPEGREVLASETLAELYARQGFVDEAADMYRELIRQRGEEAALVRRLAELEGRVSEVPEMGAAPPRWLGEDDPAIVGSGGESGSAAFADSFADGFPAEEPTALLPPVSGAGESPAEEPHEPEFETTGNEQAPAADGAEALRAEDGSDGRSISEYFGALLAWRPPTPAASVSGAPPLADAAAEDGDTEQPLFDLPAAPEASEASAVADIPLQSDASAPASDDEPFPWELPAVPRAAAPPLATPPAAEAESETPARRPEPFRRAEPPAPAAAEDDDDLESFQAWLRSLKR